ncbi:MAG: hypothetical protein P4M11_10165 [Candidatus Pacebacteria bacterium]|nr:hypothetical protein [Candidatus Paceibacterota bacterium]
MNDILSEAETEFDPRDCALAFAVNLPCLDVVCISLSLLTCIASTEAEHALSAVFEHDVPLIGLSFSISPGYN